MSNLDSRVRGKFSQFTIKNILFPWLSMAILLSKTKKENEHDHKIKKTN